jgi:hypothetical protein
VTVALFDGINFAPPAGVRSALRRGLALHEQGLSGDGVQPDTVAWARRMAAGEKVSPEKARKMARFFGRNRRFAREPKDSPAWVSWLLWGGAAGDAWSRKLVRQMNSRQQLNQRLGGVPVALAKAQGESPWNVLAYEVALKGRGPGVALARADFEQCIANFERWGKEVPVVLYHADTKDSAHPASRAAHAWITAMRVGSMRRNGATVATLEARFRWVNAETRAQVETGELAYGSVTLVQHGTDEETGDDVGSYLWSFSLTTNPALVDIPRIAAEMGGEDDSYGHGYQVSGPDDVLPMLRWAFALPALATEDDVRSNLARLDALARAGDAEALGVDLDDVVGCIRDALRLPALTTAPEVVAAALAALDKMNAPASAAGMASADDPPMNGGPRVATEKAHMAHMMTLAARLGIAAASEEDASAAIAARAQETADVRRALNLTSDATGAHVAAKIAELSGLSVKVATLTTELDAAKARESERVELDVAAHLDAMIAAQPALKPVRASLEFAARADFAAFAKANPLPRASAATTSTLTQRVTALAASHDGTPSNVVAMPARHNDAAGARARELMAADKTLTLESALKQASREIKAAR